MTEQLGFGFLPDSKPTYRELPASGWFSPRFTVNEYEARLERARKYLPSVMWPAREIYRQGLETARESFDRALDNGQARDAAVREWPSLTLQVESTQRTEFVDHCISMVDGEWDSPGLEFKVSAHKHLTRVGMYCCDTGSVVVTTWADGLVGVDFAIGRDPFFLPSFREGQRVIHAPHFEQETYDCSGEFVGLRDGVTDVPVVTIEERDYVADGGRAHHDCKRIQAWSFCSPEEWGGPTYSEAGQSKARDEGRTERGDRRGLVVRVRGQAVVLDTPVTMDGARDTAASLECKKSKAVYGGQTQAARQLAREAAPSSV